MFKKTPIDTFELLKNIKQLDNYISIQEILDEEIASGYSGMKYIYKVKPSTSKDNTKSI